MLNTIDLHTGILYNVYSLITLHLLYLVFCIVMASLQATADSIRAAVGSISTCSPVTATLLSELLLPKTSVQHITTASSSIKSTKTTASSKHKSTKPASKSRNQKVASEDKAEKGRNQLSPKERSILAT